MKDIYRLEGVRQRYGERTVLDLPSLTVKEKSIVGLSGHNGSGKSTLLRMLAFLESPAAGEIIYRGRKVYGDLTPLRKEVTLLTQEPYLLKRPVFGNVSYGLQVRGKKGVRRLVYESLEMVGLDPEKFAGRNWHELSGGEAQRVALAARLAIKPKVLLLDEPTASVDRESSEKIRRAAAMARNEYGSTLVVVSHDHNWLNSTADIIHDFSDGRLVSSTEL